MKRLAYASLLVLALATGMWLVVRVEDRGAATLAAGEDRTQTAASKLGEPVRAPVREEEPEHRALAATLPEVAEAPLAADPSASDVAVLEAHVLWADAPVTGADVELIELDDSIAALIVDESTGVIQRGTTDVGGIARFAGLRARRYGVIAGAHGARARTSIALEPGRALTRAVLALGDAGLEGTVFGVDGRFAPEARVFVRQDPRPGRSMLWFTARTDAAGTYRMDGLAGGAGQTIRAMVWEMPLGESLPLELEPNEKHKLDFGSPKGSARWSGFVRLGSGELVRGPMRIYFVPAETALVESTAVDGGSKFDIRMPSATYVARLGEPRGLVLGRADVTGSITQDLVVPGSALRGSIKYVGTKHPLAHGPEHDAILTLEREDGTHVSAGFVRGDRSYAYLGLAPGKYVLSTAPWILTTNAEHRAWIDIAAGEEVVDLALEITDP